MVGSDASIRPYQGGVGWSVMGRVCFGFVVFVPDFCSRQIRQRCAYVFQSNRWTGGRETPSCPGWCCERSQEAWTLSCIVL